MREDSYTIEGKKKGRKQRVNEASKAKEGRRAAVRKGSKGKKYRYT